MLNRLITAVVVVCLVLVGCGGESPTRSEPTPAAAPKPTKPQKSVGERVFDSSLIGYTLGDDGRVLVAFHAWKLTHDSILGDMRKFLRELLKGDEEWRVTTMSAYATSTDAYGAKTERVVYTLTVTKEEAEKVVDWNRADLTRIGEIEFVHPAVD